MPSENVATLPKTSPTAAYNTATVHGRLVGQKAHEGQYYSTVTTPAPDAFSHPQTLEIRSKRKLGEKGEEITVGVRLGGYVRKFDTTDRQTGEVGRGQVVRISLDAIED